MIMNELMSGIMGNLEKHLNTKSVIGEPITFGDVTLIPVIDLTFGFGGGGGEGADQNQQGGAGGGGGAGARLAAKSVIVIRAGEVSVLPLGKGGGIDKIFEAIPGLVEKLSSMKGAKPAAEPEAAAE